MKPPDRYTNFHEKAPQKAGTYTYTMSMWNPPGFIPQSLYVTQYVYRLISIFGSSVSCKQSKFLQKIHSKWKMWMLNFEQKVSTDVLA